LLHISIGKMGSNISGRKKKAEEKKEKERKELLTLQPMQTN